MSKQIRLSELAEYIQETIEDRFEGETFWITSEITDVKKYPDKKWCFLKFIEKEGSSITTEMKGVFWGSTYYNIQNFEKLTGQAFANGLEITCNVIVRFHKRYGLSLEVLEIDYSFTLGKLELEKKLTLERLLKENPDTIRLVDGQYKTANNKTPLPIILQSIALITAPNSDGQRDFLQELKNNPYGYAFKVKEYLTHIQGDNSSNLIIEQLKIIEAGKKNFDIVVIVRGGGSQTDFKPFDDYALSKYVASFPVPVLTGIGHDRNISIVDLMARPHKTPTKVAAFIIDNNFIFENEILRLKERLFDSVQKILDDKKRNLTDLKESFLESITAYFGNRKKDLENMKRLIKNLSPETILAKGFAMITLNGKIIVNPKDINEKSEIKTILKNEIIHSIVTQKSKYEEQS